MEWTSIKMVTPVGRVIEILRDKSVVPGDCDYYIIYDSIAAHTDALRDILDRRGSGPLRTDAAEELVRVGFLIKA